MQTKQTNPQADAELAITMDRIVAWKNPLLRRTACHIVKTALSHFNWKIWPDDEEMQAYVSSLGDADKNIVGMAWRLLGRVKIMERLDEHKRSTSKGSKGSEIAAWKIASGPIARAFLKRNDIDFAQPQTEIDFGGGARAEHQTSTVYGGGV